MKKALLLALAGLFAAVAPALAYPPAPANANFSSERGVPFGLVLDGRPLTRGMARQVHVDQLMPGLHWADFSVPTAYGGAMRFRSRVWLEPGLETTFVLVTRPGRPLYLQQVNAVSVYGGGRGYYNNGYGGRYNSPAPYPAPYGPGQGGYNNDPYNGGNPNGGYNNGQGGYNNAPNPNNGGYNNAPNNSNGGYNNTPNNGQGGYNNTPSNGGCNTPNNDNGAGYNPGSAVSSYRALAPQDMNGLVQTMQQSISEMSKLNAAKDGLKERSIQADDLDRLLRGLSSEACRIELATFAYSHVSDPENFSRVYDAFETEAGAQAVEQAVSGEPQR